MPSKHLRCFFAVLRAVLCYFSFVFISAFITWCVQYMYFDKLGERSIHFIAFFAIIFTLFSVVQSFALHDTASHEKFLAERGKKFVFSREILRVLRSPEFIAETLVFLLFISALPTLPLGLGYTNITSALFYGKNLSALQKKLCIFALMLPLVLAAEILMRTLVRKDWFSQSLAQEKPHGALKSSAFLLVRLTAILLIYAVGFMTFPIYLGNAPAALMILGAVLPFLIAILLLFFIYSYVFAFRARKRFIKSLKKLCREKGFALSEIRVPYSFIFRMHKGYNFTVTAHGKTYDCKFLSGIHKNSPVMFDLFGAGVWLHYFRIRGKEIFKYVHRFEYAFESENTKILIVSPAPKEMFVGENMRRRRADTGETLGEYKLLNEKGFLRSLELDVMEAKGRFE